MQRVAVLHGPVKCSQRPPYAQTFRSQKYILLLGWYKTGGEHQCSCKGGGRERGWSQERMPLPLGKDPGCNPRLSMPREPHGGGMRPRWGEVGSPCPALRAPGAGFGWALRRRRRRRCPGPKSVFSGPESTPCGSLGPGQGRSALGSAARSGGGRGPGAGGRGRAGGGGRGQAPGTKRRTPQNNLSFYW